MELIKNLKQINQPYNNAVVTVGNFDGVHLGHNVLFNKVVRTAQNIGGTSVVMTFEPHPAKVFKKDNQYPLSITLLDQKIELIGESGIDVLICIEFNHDFASISANDFVEKILVNLIGMKVIVIGEDYTFGKNREGNFQLLKAYGKRFNFEVMLTNDVQIGQERISSTKIRQMVSSGMVFEVRNLLGRFYQIRGRILSGRSRGGRLLGFPTANIALTDELSPAVGVYAVTVELHGRIYKGAANVGFSPTFGDNIFTVEVYILDFNQDIYGEQIRVSFIKRLRSEKKFSEVSKLSKQIKKDIKKAKEVLLDF